MDVRKAYDLWSAQYDTNKNKTRDLEAIALRESLQDVFPARCLEIGCGTGKNTEWLAMVCGEVTAVDLSSEMLAKAREKVSAGNVQFIEADISRQWTFVNPPYDLVTFSLILEHIFDLNPVFKEAAASLTANGTVYVGELHPFKQYAGTKARFETEDGEQQPECFNHHISDFTQTAKSYGLILTELREYFDDEDRTTIPRILSLLFSKEV